MAKIHGIPQKKIRPETKLGSEADSEEVILLGEALHYSPSAVVSSTEMASVLNRNFTLPSASSEMPEKLS